MAEIRQFLVMRSRDGRLRSILVFDRDDPDAIRAYENAERRGIDCCLFGTDCLSTLARTHPNWLDEPMADFEALLDAAASPRKESDAG